jgi:hypothetical protein
MWIGLLFAFMCLAVQYQQFSPIEARQQQNADSDPEIMIEILRERTIQCLGLGRYMDGPRYTVETLLLYLFIEVLRGDNTETTSGTWVLWGSVVRIAERLGYHRDGSHFPDLFSPFEAETRRRVWAIVVQWDMFISLQFGLPRMVRESQSDTAEPRNLVDEDLNDGLTELPPARPESAKTIPQYHVAKNRLLSVAAMISDLTSSIKPPTAGEVLRLDELLTNTFQTILPVWQPSPTQQPDSTPSDEIPVSPATVSVRCTFLTLMYHRAQIVLHHRYLHLSGDTSEQIAYSRKTCIEAALAIQVYQWTLYLQTQVGGPLCRHGWKFLSLLGQDFLLATAILCAELAQSLSSNETSDSEKRPDHRVYHAASSAYIVWLQSAESDSSRAVRTVVAALKFLLAKAQNAEEFRRTRNAPQSSPADPQGAAQEAAYVEHPFVSLNFSRLPTSVKTYPGIANFPI